MRTRCVWPWLFCMTAPQTFTHVQAWSKYSQWQRHREHKSRNHTSAPPLALFQIRNDGAFLLTLRAGKLLAQRNGRPSEKLLHVHAPWPDGSGITLQNDPAAATCTCCSSKESPAPSGVFNADGSCWQRQANGIQLFQWTKKAPFPGQILVLITHGFPKPTRKGRSENLLFCKGPSKYLSEHFFPFTITSHF